MPQDAPDLAEMAASLSGLTPAPITDAQAPTSNDGDVVALVQSTTRSRGTLPTS